MATINDVIGGLQVFSKYSGDAEGNICAEHDAIYAGIDVPITSEDEQLLKSFGWHWDRDTGSWVKFV